MYDGTPKGFGVATFAKDGSDWNVRYRPTNRPEGNGIRIDAPDRITADDFENGKATFRANVFNGGEDTSVRIRIKGETEWVDMERSIQESPFYRRLYERDHSAPMEGTRRMKDPKFSFSLFTLNIPSGRRLAPGTYTIEVEAEDPYGNRYSGRRPLQVTEE